MDWRVKRITEELKKHDRNLFAMRTNTGMVQVWRKAERWAAAENLYGEFDRSSNPMNFITALTDNWKLDGEPVDRGIEPLMHMLRNMDSWTRGSQLDQMRKRREKEKEDLDRQKRNEIRALAADSRKDFAKATNDINTSAWDMTDARRKYGNS